RKRRLEGSSRLYSAESALSARPWAFRPRENPLCACGRRRLLETSGAKSYQPLLNVERAEFARPTGDEASRERALREAQAALRRDQASGGIEPPSEGAGPGFPSAPGRPGVRNFSLRSERCDPQ